MRAGKGEKEVSESRGKKRREFLRAGDGEKRVSESGGMREGSL